MKLRFDFVSNSSSSSFVLRGEYAAKGIRLLKRIVESCEVPWEVENEIVLHVHALNKNMPALSRLLDDDNYGNYGRCSPGYDCENGNSPNERSWHSIEVSLSESGLSKLTDEALEKIDDIEFYLGDGHTPTLVLKLLYIFFQKNGCCPDALNTERDFMCPDCKEDFMYALARGIPAEEKEEERNERAC